MKGFRLPSRPQLITAIILLFTISMAFQASEVYRTAGYFNVLDVSVSSALLIVAFFFIYILQKYTPAYFSNPLTRAGLIGIMVFKVVFIQKILLQKFIPDESYNTIFSETTLLRVFLTFLIIAYYSFALWLLFQIKKTSEDDALKQSAENSLRDAELMKLRQQIQPHFLFNSLNSINALVGTEPGQARKMIQNLSDFLRGTLKKDENKNVPLAEEIELLKLYLDIEKVRFGHRLSVVFNLDENLLSKTIPPLLLQPVVENAIKFGLYNVLNEVEIKISVQLKDKLLMIDVTNPYDEATAITRKGEGFGLSLIQRRLQLIYHRADLLKTEKSNNVFRTSILIPQG